MTRHGVLVPLIDHENSRETLATWKIFRLRECKKPTVQIAELSSRDHMKTNTMNSRLSRLGISWYRFYETGETADARYWRSNLEAMERHSLWPVGHSSKTASLLHSRYHFYGLIMIFLVLLTSPNNVLICVHSASSLLLISFNLYQFINKAGFEPNCWQFTAGDSGIALLGDLTSQPFKWGGGAGDAQRFVYLCCNSACKNLSASMKCIYNIWIHIYMHIKIHIWDYLYRFE